MYQDKLHGRAVAIRICLSVASWNPRCSTYTPTDWKAHKWGCTTRYVSLYNKFHPYMHSCQQALCSIPLGHSTHADTAAGIRCKYICLIIWHTVA